MTIYRKHLIFRLDIKESIFIISNLLMLLGIKIIPLLYQHENIKGRIQKKNSKIWGFCPKFIDPHPPPPNWDKKNLGLFAQLLDPLPPS